MKILDIGLMTGRVYDYSGSTKSDYRRRCIVTNATREHERQADKNAPRTRAAVIWAIEHRDDHANTVF